MAPKTTIRAAGAKALTNSDRSSPRPLAVVPDVQHPGAPGGQHAAASSATASSSRCRPRVPELRSGQTDQPRPTRSTGPADAGDDGDRLVLLDRLRRPRPARGRTPRDRLDEHVEIPPQVSPTAKASSSLTPYRSSVGTPDSTTSLASS
jgi:hypothetical protein